MAEAEVVKQARAIQKQRRQNLAGALKLVEQQQAMARKQAEWQAEQDRQERAAFKEEMEMLLEFRRTITDPGEFGFPREHAAGE